MTEEKTLGRLIHNTYSKDETNVMTTKVVIYDDNEDTHILHYIEDRFGDSKCVSIGSSNPEEALKYIENIDLLNGTDNEKVFNGLLPTTDNHIYVINNDYISRNIYDRGEFITFIRSSDYSYYVKQISNDIVQDIKNFYTKESSIDYVEKYLDVY